MAVPAQRLCAVSVSEYSGLRLSRISPYTQYIYNTYPHTVFTVSFVSMLNSLIFTIPLCAPPSLNDTIVYPHSTQLDSTRLLYELLFVWIKDLWCVCMSKKGGGKEKKNVCVGTLSAPVCALHSTECLLLPYTKCMLFIFVFLTPAMINDIVLCHNTISNGTKTHVHNTKWEIVNEISISFRASGSSIAVSTCKRTQLRLYLYTINNTWKHHLFCSHAIQLNIVSDFSSCYFFSLFDSFFGEGEKWARTHTEQCSSKKLHFIPK